MLLASKDDELFKDAWSKGKNIVIRINQCKLRVTNVTVREIEFHCPSCRTTLVVDLQRMTVNRIKLNGRINVEEHVNSWVKTVSVKCPRCNHEDDVYLNGNYEITYKCKRCGGEAEIDVDARKSRWLLS